MKTPPDNPEFANFTAAMKHIMTVSKVELKRRHEERGPTKRKPKASNHWCVKHIYAKENANSNIESSWPAPASLQTTPAIAPWNDRRNGQLLNFRARGRSLPPPRRQLSHVATC